MRAADERPIACALKGGSYQDRLAWIAELTRDGLRGHERRDLVLALTYARRVADRVREMVAQEQDCCGFLAFDIHETHDEIRVTIAAPERARNVADLLFAPFLPHPTRDS